MGVYGIGSGATVCHMTLPRSLPGGEGEGEFRIPVRSPTVAFLGGWSMWDSVASLKRRISVHVAVLRECMQRMLYHRLYECKLYSVGKVSDLLLYDIIRLIVGRLLA